MPFLSPERARDLLRAVSLDLLRVPTTTCRFLPSTEALHYFKIYKAKVENQLEKNIKWLQTDRGAEYFSNNFSEFCAEHGIIHEKALPCSPQSNGIAERKNHTLTKLVNAILKTAGLSREWWGEAILAACHVLSRVSTKNKEITPFKE
jgi:transposase InsO family protein